MQQLSAGSPVERKEDPGLSPCESQVFGRSQVAGATEHRCAETGTGEPGKSSGVWWKSKMRLCQEGQRYFSNILMSNIFKV